MAFTVRIVIGGLIVAALMPGHGAAGATTFSVNSVADTGDSSPDSICDDGAGNCTLREAIEEANALAGTDTISFDIPGAPPHRIQPASELPAITSPIVIDGTTEPDYGAAPAVELNGALALPQGVNGLRIIAGASTVRGLAINQFTTGAGVKLDTNGGNTIQGNLIGTDITGTIPIGNGDGIVTLSPANVIGGSAAGQGNVISGNNWEGIDVQLGSTGTVIRGNKIGTDITGEVAMGNSGDAGVRIVVVSGVTVGGTAAGAGNVISANSVGIELNGSPHGNNIIQGNFIGTNASGTAALGNFLGGVKIVLNQSDVIGGAAAGARNIISGNLGYGILLDFGTHGNIIQGNFIGTDASGGLQLGNVGNGISILNGYSNVVGGTTPGAANTIAYNQNTGVLVSGSSSNRNPIRGNSIHSNAGAGITLVNSGNAGLPAPVVSATGSASGTACPSCVVDVYSDGSDEGRLYEGTTSADGLGNWSFSGLVSGPSVTATATDGLNNTSAFSLPLACLDSDEDAVCDSADPDDDDDGFEDWAEVSIGTDAGYPCGFNSWPADLYDVPPLSENRITVQDLTAFIAPVRRLGTSPGDADFNARWDIVPGKGIFSATINVQDMTRLVTLEPPMLNGARALNGPACPYPSQ